MTTHNYENLVHSVLTEGFAKNDRTGVGTVSLTGGQIIYDLSKGFPLITTKRVFFRGVIEELLWFLRGSTNAQELASKGVHIWDAWASEDGELGPVYGAQWRHWPAPDGAAYDQITSAIELVRTDPASRRIIVSAWNVAELDKMALPPCHMMFQLIVQGDRLDCVVTQRSADMFLGVPFDIASYALLTTMFAQQTGFTPGKLIWNGGDCHIYNNHREQVLEMLNRLPLEFPRLTLREASSIFDYKAEDITLEGYSPWPAISAPVAV